MVALKSNHMIFKAFFLLLVVQSLVLMAKSKTQFSKTLYSLQGAKKGDTVKGLNEVKQYLKVLGYYLNKFNHTSITDYYDDTLEYAIKMYQKYYRLKISGKLDSNTIKQMMMPRCGVADINFKRERKKRWSKRELTYTFSSSEQVISDEQMSSIVASAFSKWTKVTGLTIQKVPNSSVEADMVLGFHRGKHVECRIVFDGPLSILAHASYPERGICHFDAEESWSTLDQPSRFPDIDFEAVALHEMGHLLGLEHSQDVNAVMYSQHSFEDLKRDLRQDDINRIRKLYNFTS